MTYAGYEELMAYVRDAEQPSFKEFVDRNSLNIPRWSANNNLEANELFSVWRRRYALLLKDYKKTDCILSSKKYDEKNWKLIAKMSKTLSEASLVTRIEMLEAMIAAAPSTSNILKELLTSQKDEHDQQQRQEQEEIQHHEEQEEEGIIRFSGKELSDVEKNYLRSITNEETIKSCIQFLAAQRLLLDDLDVMDTIIAKLGISRIVNAINPTIRNLIYSNLNDNEKQVFLTKSAGTSLTGLEPDLCTVIDNIIKVDESGKPKMCSMEDMDELFEQIQAKKT